MKKTSSVRKLSDLIEVYYNSIGNNGVLLLNVSPDTQGIIRQDQEERLLQMRAYLEETFCVNLAGNAAVVCTAEAKGHEAVKVLDGGEAYLLDKPRRVVPGGQHGQPDI